MKIVKDYWQFATVLIMLIAINYSNAKRVGAYEAKSMMHLKAFDTHCANQREDLKIFIVKIEENTKAITKSNSLLEIYFIKQGIAAKKDLSDLIK